MSFRQALVSLAVAVAAGLLLGAERQQNAKGRERGVFGGIRTFPMISLLGALGALARPVAGMWLLAALLVGLVAFLTVSHVRSSAHDDLGVSSEVAALIAYALGAIATMHGLMPDASRHLLVGAVTAVVLTLLALEQPLHGFASRISDEDVRATAKFVILALIVLPVLPHGVYGPLGVLAPYKIGTMIVLVAAISFAGYVAARLVGAARGLLVSGLLGGLVSSTAVTLTYSGRGRNEPALAPLCAVAIISACSMMFARIVAIVAVVDQRLIAAIAPPLVATAAAGFAASWWFYRRASEKSESSAPEGEHVSLRNPFELRSALSFGLMYGVVLFVAKAAQTYLGSGGLYLSAVLAGLTDVDAITLSVSELHRAGLAGSTASTAIMLAAVTNTFVKSGIALWVGGAAVGGRVAASLGAALAVGGAVHVVMRLV